MTVHNLGAIKKMKIGQEGPMCNHTDFCIPACGGARTAVMKVNGASVLELITQAADIQSKKKKKRTLP